MALISVIDIDFGCISGAADTQCPRCGQDLRSWYSVSAQHGDELRCSGSGCTYRRPIVSVKVTGGNAMVRDRVAQMFGTGTPAAMAASSTLTGPPRRWSMSGTLDVDPEEFKRLIDELEKPSPWGDDEICACAHPERVHGPHGCDHEKCDCAWFTEC